ncbi:glycosyltransferase family 4 protein [Candidatus Dependentiae bacterium]
MTRVVIALKIFFSLTLSFLFAFYLVPLLRVVAIKLNVLDVPDGSVKKHKEPVPYLGGVAIYIAFIVALALVLPFENNMFPFLTGSTLLLFVGLIDDLVPLRPYQKFAGQIIAALCFLRAGFYLKAHFFYNYWAIPISFFWMLSLINAFNLVDVMDGLAATLAGCATVSFLVMALYMEQPVVAILLCALLGSLVGFFWYNKPNAKMYMGDAGSLFVGGIMATVPFMIHWGQYNWYGYIAPIIILAIPLLEICTLVVVRMYRGIPFYLPSPDHFSIYLQKKKGWSKWGVLVYVMALSLILFIGSFLFLTGLIGLPLLISVGAIFLVIWFNILFKKIESDQKMLTF